MCSMRVQALLNVGLWRRLGSRENGQPLQLTAV
jgi:hypothetical protein